MAFTCRLLSVGLASFVPRFSETIGTILSRDEALPSLNAFCNGQSLGDQGEFSKRGKDTGAGANTATHCIFWHLAGRQYGRLSATGEVAILYCACIGSMHISRHP
jgi:hypothetical protein